MIDKALIIGPSTTGKTTLVAYLREKTSLPISESDEELTHMNGGTYPEDSDHKMNILASQMVENILNKGKIIFFTNTHYFSIEKLKEAHDKGFLILQLTTPIETMRKRSKYRNENEGYEDHTKYFDDMLTYQKEISESGVVDEVIDTSKPVENTAEELLTFLS